MIIYIIFFIILLWILYCCYQYLTKNKLKLNCFYIAVILFFFQVVSIYGNISSGYGLFDIFTEEDYLYSVSTRIIGLIGSTIGFCLWAELGLGIVFFQIYRHKKQMKEVRRQ